ncbi:energy-coupling factor transporter transmembrane component T family protein [Bradyrhizobium guangdongense]|uniref:energy-coupling factor transporter transmembrane component T family protein n=1 Tax=Bradyrhizobium guangdongense TaxID=1325090 RepID=UPI001642D608|nr:energy-coupling factor transporter transmembrane component T [Bradyrhizobium guangdongense]
MIDDAKLSLAARLDPLAKLAWLLAAGVASSVLATSSKLLAMTLIVGAGFLMCRPRELANVYRYRVIIFLVPSLLLFFNAIMIPIYSAEVWQVSVIKWSALAYSLKIFNSILALVFFLVSTDIRQLVNRLTWARVPVGVAFSIYLMLRFIEILRVDALHVRDALRMRRSPRPPLSGLSVTMGRYLATLVLLGIYRSEQAAMAMDLRGFSSSKGRTFYADQKWSRASWLLLFAGIVLIAIITLTTTL